MQRSPVSETTVRAFSELVALKAPSDRTAMLAATFNALILPALRQLDEVAAGEVQPAPAFDPRWKEGEV